MNLDRAEQTIQGDRNQANSKFPLFADLFAKDEQSTRGQQIYDRWKIWHETNPRVYQLFVRFTFDLINAGRQHGSADMICHRIRWESALAIDSTETVKLNNDYVALWSRLFAVDYPKYANFFSKRRRTSEDRPAFVIDNPVTDFGPPVHEAGLEHSLTEIAHLNTREFHRP